MVVGFVKYAGSGVGIVEKTEEGGFVEFVVEGDYGEDGASEIEHL